MGSGSGVGVGVWVELGEWLGLNLKKCERDLE